MHRLQNFFQPSDAVPNPLRQYVRISNILSVVLIFLSLCIMGSLYYFYGWEDTYFIILTASASFFCVTFIEKAGYYNFSRIFFCFTAVALTLGAAVFTKFENHDTRSYLTYFDSRFILLAVVIIPGVIFRLEERGRFWFGVILCFSGLMLYDWIHYLFGYDFYQLGFDEKGYYHINFIVLICFVGLLLGIIVLKGITESTERKYQERNLNLIDANNEMEAQNEELQQQQEEISAGRDKLEEANQVILSQQEKLINHNLLLEARVEEHSRNLVKTNEELIKHNNELRQFSYTVSHNLRGPVARLLGLTNLFNLSQNNDEQRQIINLLHQSTLDLDAVLKDLNFIIDIRNDLYRVRERVSFEEEWMKAQSMLLDSLRKDYQITADFSKAPYIFGIKAMLQSILYNLLSNSIKYRSPERPLAVSLSTSVNSENQIVLKVTDNGLGIDLTQHQEQVFKLYKRFHTHVTGKGLGLYLVKTQAEALSATVELESELNVGTTFRFVFTTPPDLDKQVFFESEVAKLYYDAYLNNTVIIWKRNITTQEYRKAFEAVMQTLKTYKTPGWIADLRNQGVVPDEDQYWFMNTVLAEAVHLGLKRIAAVGFKDPLRENYYKRMIDRTAQTGVTLQVFETLEEASDWMQSFISN